MMELIIAPSGVTRCIYGEELDLSQLGEVQIQRASRVEPDSRGFWYADLSPVGGPTLGPFHKRSEALDAEVIWLRLHALDQLNSQDKESRYERRPRWSDFADFDLVLRGQLRSRLRPRIGGCSGDSVESKKEGTPA